MTFPYAFADAFPVAHIGINRQILSRNQADKRGIIHRAVIPV